MPDARPFRVEPATPQHGAALATLLNTNGFGCHCRYWHFAGNHREWLARCAHTPDDNRAELLAAIDAGSDEARGMVAHDERGELIGWLKLAPARVMGKLYEQRLYKGLPCLQRDATGVWTIGCLFVREDQRRRGVATALLAGAIQSAAEAGARALEAFPRSDVDVAAAALMMGPLALFVRGGFEVVHDFTPYPVLRLELDSKGGGLKARDVPPHGIWVVDKPSGPTSHDIVAQARRFLGTRRVGHAGTLDPLATGVLVLLLGEATKLSDVATREDKTYRAKVCFGKSTSSHDADGATVEECALVPGWLNAEALEAALELERCRTRQEPPAVSAIKVGGQRAYRLARNGAAPALEPRAVEARSIRLLLHERGPEGRDTAELELSVSKGYYVRALARDLGAALGVPAHLSSLRRLWSGRFCVDEACAWPPRGEPAVIALRDALPRLLPTRQLTALGVERARQGKALSPDDFLPGSELSDDAEGVVAWTDAEGNPVALGRRQGDVYRVQRGFTADAASPEAAQTANFSPV